MTLLAAACGDGDSASDVDAGQASGVELPPAAVERLHGQPDEIPPELAAANGQLLMVGGLEATDAPGVLRLADDALLIDVASGEEAAIPAPRADLPVHVDGAAAGNDGFVAIGNRCAGGDELPSDEWLCAPGSGTAFLLAPGARAWEEIPFPDAISPARTDQPWTFQARMGTTPRGEVFALVRSGPSEAAVAKPQKLLVLERGTWVERAALPDERSVGACASQNAFYALTSTPSAQPTGDGTPPPATMTLYEVPRRGGEPVVVPLPEVDTSFGGVAVALACDRSGPYLTSSTPAPDAPMALFGRRSGRWQNVEGEWAPGIVERLASAPDGVAVVSMAVTADRFDTHTVAAGKASASSVAARYGERHFVPDATSGGFVTVGPIADLGLTLEEPDASARTQGGAETVTVDQIDF